MSATATPSDQRSAAAGRARRSVWAPRWLVVAHRYLGVVLGALMLLWCLSGMVMLFVAYPSLSQDERVAHLPRIDWSHCCVLDGAAAPDAPIASAAIEQLAGAPVLRLRPKGGPAAAFDLTNGHPTAALSAMDAEDVAQAWGAVGAVTQVARDQWTVSSEFNRGRPFWRVRLADGAATDLYVSQKTGEVVQRTTASSRVLNWFGAVPHWLYPTLLRQYPRLWTQVVIWTSLAGAFLTLAGLYLGLIAWRPFGDARLTPFRGLMAWHHLAGLTAGLLTLSWVVSGLLSMNPWGLLESPERSAALRIAGPAPRFADVQAALEAVAAQRPAVGQLHLAPLDGRVFIVAGDQRLDVAGRPAPLTSADLAAAGTRLGPVASQGLLTAEDAYYFRHHEPLVLPVWRVVLTNGTRAYIDPRSGALIANIDAPAKGYRWLYQGLHRLDVVPGFRRGPVWAGVSLLLLAAATFGVGTGVWLGWRRIGLDFHHLRQRLRAG